ncbi:MAG: bifunctional hydroxymethylpyrimidine kinase/phosphomethylpyrimidine kinase [Planctomycetota bacterium]
MSSRPIALTIAGSDPSGGAGIQADLKTFTALGVYGSAVLAALTAQNTKGVSGVHQVPAEFLRAQLHAVLDDLRVDAIKIGMLGNREAIAAVVESFDQDRARFVVLDPVMVATSGDRLIDEQAAAALRETLLPLCDLCTPNLAEAAVLLGTEPARTDDDMLRQAQGIRELGARAVLVKGGHGSGSEARDVLVDQSGPSWFSAPRIATTNTHGTGCTLSSAIAALKARGEGLVPAIEQAKSYLHRAIVAADDLDVGSGHGPVDHLVGWSPQ